MDPSEFRERHNAIQERFAEAKESINNSKRPDDDEVERCMRTVDHALSETEEMIELYSSTAEDITEQKRILAQTSGELEALEEIIDTAGAPVSVSEAQDRHESFKSQLSQTLEQHERAADKIKQSLNHCEELCAKIEQYTVMKSEGDGDEQMLPSNFRDRHTSVRQRYQEAKSYIEHSEQSFDADIESAIEILGAGLSSLDDQIAEYESAADTIARQADDRSRSKEAQRTVELHEKLGEQIEANLELCDKLCTAIGRRIATTNEYDPTAATAPDGLDAATQAGLNDILTEIATEDRSEWYNP
jgi:hypothetical protein